jgi:hypothetical protein
LIALNPIIKEGVEIGMTLKVPENGSSTSSQKRIHFNTKINFDTRKRLVFIAFNISRIERFYKYYIRTFKKDKFFKHDFRFYAGALIAIDSNIRFAY